MTQCSSRDQSESHLIPYCQHSSKARKQIRVNAFKTSRCIPQRIRAELISLLLSEKTARRRERKLEILEMHSIRQVLRLGARVACSQRAACRAPILREPSGVGALRHVRLAHEDGGGREEPLGKVAGKMRLMFTCKKCGTRTSKLISKLAYDKGVVIVRCDGCKNNHLIADNLGWFSEINSRINIEKLMQLKGETVRKVMNDVDGYYEAISKEEFKSQSQKASDEIKPEDECPDKIKMIEKSKGS